MELIETGIDSLLIVRSKVFHDSRGFFFEGYNKKTWAEAGLNLDIVQTKTQWVLGDGHVTTIDNLISLWKFDQALLDSKADHDLHLHAGVETYVDVKYACHMCYII